MAEVFSKEVPTLLSTHFEQLHNDSAISIDLIKERQYESTLGRKRLADLGFNPSQRHIPGIIIPLWGVNGQITGYQYRPDHPRLLRDKVTKYENQPGSSIRLDIPLRCRLLLGDPKIPIFFVEGVKKADSLASQGACVVGLNGVWGFKGRNPLGGTTILADFDYITLKERESYVVYDSDYATIPQVHQAQDRLAEHLGRKGSKVKIVNLPAKSDGSKQGADDFLAAGHNIAELLALAKAVEIEPSVRHRGYIWEDKDGKPIKLDLVLLVSDLLKEYHFAALVDTHEILIYWNGVWKSRGPEFIERECQRRVPDSELLTKYKINEVVGHIQRSTYCDRSLFNREKWVLNLENGLLDIRNKELKPHIPEFFCTIRIPVAYDPQADCPRIRQFFGEVLRPEDLPVIEELFGYCLISDYSIQKAFLFLGDGANGKSTLLELLKYFLGKDNCTNISLQDLEGRRFAIADLFGKLANIHADIPSTKMERVGLFKMLTGGDTIGAEKKFKDRFSFNNCARLIFSTNKPPKVDEDTLAFWRRWIFINFPNKFEGAKADKRLLQKLTKKEELSGLLNMALGGLERLLNLQSYSHELSPDEIAEWHQRVSDPIYAFVEDVCEINADAWISKDDLYDAFVGYCNKQNVPKIGIESFGRTLKNAKNVHVIFKRQGPRGAQKTGWKGIQLKGEEKEEDFT
ncbi:MAG: phage/plasmid primase, P4 family [Chloroflexota bacterium]